MIKKTIEKTFLNFEELDEYQKEKVIDEYRFVNVDYDEWNYFLIEDFIRDVEKIGISLTSDDLIWEVGDRNSKFGVISRNVINQLISKYADSGVYDISTTDKLGSFLRHLGGGICSRDQTESDMATIYFEEDTDEKTKTKIENEINYVINTIIDLCGDYHTKNEEEYQNAISDEAIKNYLIENEMTFDIDEL